MKTARRWSYGERRAALTPPVPSHAKLTLSQSGYFSFPGRPGEQCVSGGAF
jgi:hypothetical protein